VISVPQTQFGADPRKLHRNDAARASLPPWHILGMRSFAMGGQTGAPGNDNLQTQGRKENAAQPPGAAEGVGESAGGAERYPPEGKDDSIETPDEARSFGGEHANPKPRQGAGEGGPDPSVNEGRLGPAGDPAEGKR
jgi:hypothetical protein